MKKISILLLAAFFGLAFIAKKQKYTSTNLKRRVILDVPEEFLRLSDTDIITKYGMDKLPLALFEDETGEISISITEKIDSLKSRSLMYKTEEEKIAISRDLAIEKSFLISSYRHFYDDIKILKDTVMEINGVPMALLEYESKLSGKDAKDLDVVSEQYNYLVYGYRRNRNYIINFACPQYKQAEFQAIAQHIVESVKF